MPHLPHISIYSADGNKLEQLFDPGEFFNFATILSFVRSDFNDQQDQELALIGQAFQDLISNIVKQTDNQMEELFIWYCSGVTSVGQTARAYGAAVQDWFAVPEDFDPDIRIFLMYLFQSHARLEGKEFALVMGNIFGLFRMLVVVYAENFARRDEPDFHTDSVEPFYKTATTRKAQVALAKLDSLIAYLHRTDEGEVFVFGP